MKKENEKLKKDGKDNTTIKDIIIYLSIIIIAVLIRTYVVALVRVNGTSMYPTLENKDFMILNKINYRFNDIKRFDIVVIKEEKEYLIKRVIGLPGDKIEYKNNKLYVNGKYVEEKFGHKRTNDFTLDELKNKTVPKNTYFVLGDNRTNSIDSRIIGFIPRNRIVGKTSLTILPFNRIGNKK